MRHSWRIEWTFSESSRAFILLAAACWTLIGCSCSEWRHYVMASQHAVAAKVLLLGSGLRGLLHVSVVPHFQVLHLQSTRTMLIASYRVHMLTSCTNALQRKHGLWLPSKDNKLHLGFENQQSIGENARSQKNPGDENDRYDLTQTTFLQTKDEKQNSQFLMKSHYFNGYKLSKFLASHLPVVCL